MGDSVRIGKGRGCYTGEAFDCIFSGTEKETVKYTKNKIGKGGLTWRKLLSVPFAEHPVHEDTHTFEHTQ